MRFKRRPRWTTPLGWSTAALLSLAPPASNARVLVDSDYNKSQTYSGALRYLRVDLGYEITEKDPDAAYLLFHYTAPGQAKPTSSGSIEIIEGKERVRIVIQLPRMPEYHERVLRDGLMRKLRDEYGPAPIREPREKNPPKKPADDVDKEKEKEREKDKETKDPPGPRT